MPAVGTGGARLTAGPWLRLLRPQPFRRAVGVGPVRQIRAPVADIGHQRPGRHEEHHQHGGHHLPDPRAGVLGGGPVRLGLGLGGGGQHAALNLDPRRRQIPGADPALGLVAFQFGELVPIDLEIIGATLGGTVRAGDDRPDHGEHGGEGGDAGDNPENHDRRSPSSSINRASRAVSSASSGSVRVVWRRRVKNTTTPMIPIPNTTAGPYHST